MAGLDSIFLPTLSPWRLLGLELYFLEAVASGLCPPALMIYRLAGRFVSIGRYHLYAGPEQRSGVGCYRRLTGGRIVGAGEGWLGCSLILPTRSALLAERDAGLKPEQVMNRYVRGVLSGLRALGVDCFYPGRDAITASRREIAMCSFETERSGALLLDVLIAVDRGLEETVRDLECLDPEGTLVCPLYDRESATNVVREVGREVTFAQLAEVIEGGYQATLGGVKRRELTGDEEVQADRRGAALADSGWLAALSPDPALNRVGRTATQLGSMQAHLALDSGGQIKRLMLSGDFIANSGAIADFEAELIGKRPDLAALTAAAAKVFGDGRNYILGVGELTDLINTVSKAS